MSDTILEVKGLKKYFPVSKGFFGRNKSLLKAVDDVSFSIPKGKTLGIVGESGCGKSTLGRTILGLYEKTGGEIWFDGINTESIQDKLWLKRRMQMIFQDPYASLNPRMDIYTILEEPFRVHNIGTQEERRKQIIAFLERVGLGVGCLNRFPHEFSGGQRQRIGIARALLLKPELIICDEPISALDVSIQAQVINLLKEFQEEFGLSYLFIAHDLSMVKYISDAIGVMYLGAMVEMGEKNQIGNHMLHPYTKALFESEPLANPRLALERKHAGVEGEIPSPMNPPSGCKFRTRCPKAMEICKEQVPSLQNMGDGHWVACHLYNGCSGERKETAKAVQS